jgi:hypothetical protein
VAKKRFPANQKKKMQNETNFRSTKMTTTSVVTKDYEMSKLPNAPKTNPILPAVSLAGQRSSKRTTHDAKRVTKDVPRSTKK